MEDIITQCIKVAAEDYIQSVKKNRSVKVRKLRLAALFVVEGK